MMEYLIDVAQYLPPLESLSRVVILGGSFNPPHVGHAFLAHLALIVTDAEQVWVLPVADHPFQKQNVALEHRMEMSRINFRDLGSRVAILDLEAHLPKPSYTVQTLRLLKEATPSIHYTLLFGSDIIGDLPKWRTPEELSRYADILVYPRDGYPIGSLPNYLNATTIANGVIPRLSSTYIREHFGELSEMDGRISPDVLRYARKYNLY